MVTRWILALTPGADAPAAQAPQAAAAAARVIGAEPTAWAVAAAAEVQQRLQAATEDEPFALTGREPMAMEAVLLGLLTYLVTKQAPSAPVESVDQVRWAARQGMTIDQLLTIIWSSHTGAQQLVIDAMTEHVPSDQLATEIRELSHQLATFVAVIIRDLSTVFEEESAAWGRHRSAAIRRAVDVIIDSGTAPSGTEELIGVRLKDHHLAAVLGPVDGQAEPGWNPELARWVELVHQRIGPGSTLIMPRTDGSTEAVWSSPAAPSAAALAAIMTLRPPAGTSVSLGFAMAKVEGLRASLLAARRMAVVARRAGIRRTWSYDREASTALLLTDDAACRDFVQRVLSGLLGSDEKTASLRSTLRVFLEYGRSRSASAERLHIAPTRVAYRVRQATDRLGLDESDSLYEVITALRLTEHFPDLAG